MVCSSWFAFLALGVIGTSPAWAADNGIESTKLAADDLILECESNQACQLVANAVEASGGVLHYLYESDVFHGVSFQLPKSATAEERTALVAQFKGIKASWPVQDITLVPEDIAKDQPEDKLQVLKGGEEKRAPLGRRADDDGVETPWNHLMTHVDKLHEEGYLGSGIKIAVIDTGAEQVDYNHPALGGCFGPGCRVVTGENFSNQGNRSDPIDCSYKGHGTIVAGILAGYSKADGFVGAAPNATIMAYRVVDCEVQGREDDMIAGWLKAKQDGAQIMVSSVGFQGENWAQRPLAVVAARIVASGVPCIVALGNKKDHGLFYALNPSTGRGVTSVNSFGRSLVALEHRGEYSVGTGSEPVDFAFEPGRGLHDWDGEWRPVHDVDADFGDKPDDDLTGAEEVPDYLDEDTVLGDNCKLSPGNSSTGFARDLAGHIALIRQTPETNGCHFYDRVRNAVARGAAHILAWQDAPNYIMIRGQDAHGVRAIGITRTDDGRAMARALASGQPLTARRAGRVRIDTGVIAPMSAYGPTWDMDIKPTIGAPGHQVPVTRKGGGYDSDSGTSFAGPLVAGVFALVAEARGTFDPALLNSLITSTGAPQSSHGRLITVAQQGGGLLRAWEAAHATTLVEPSTLPFNDTDHRPDSIGLRITNTAKTEVTGLDPERLPLWSGWVGIQGSDGTNLTVPYLGLGGSLRSAAVLDPASKLSTLAGSDFILPNPPEGQTSGPFQGIAEPAAAVRSEAISTSFDLVLGSPQVRVDIVALDVCPTPALVGTRANATGPDLSQACVPDSIVTEFAGVKSIGQLPGYPKHYVKREEIQIRWDGAFAPGQYAPPGRYKIVARALSIMGDAADEAHWQTVESPVFSILYEGNVKRAQEDHAAQPAQTPEEEDAPAANAGDALAADKVKHVPES
ncbi:Minor extracellular protease vpr [Metarhizium anisopliae]